jgi:hypothetical protein
MRRFMITALVAVTAVVGTLSLSGCIIVPPHDRDRVVVHDRGDYHHDRDRDDRDHDHWH